MKTIKAITDSRGKLLMLLEKEDGNEVPVKTIYKPDIAAKMRDKGHKIVRVRADEHNPMKDCWDFAYDETFDADFEEIIKNR